MKTLRISEKIVAWQRFRGKTPAQVVCEIYHLDPAQVITGKYEPENRCWVFEIEGAMPRAGGPN